MNNDDLRKLAEAATPGPWRHWETSAGARVAGRPDDRSRNFVCDVLHPELAVSFKDNAAFIAAANPTKIIELLDTIEQQRELLAQAAEAINWHLEPDSPDEYEAVWKAINKHLRKQEGEKK